MRRGVSFTGQPPDTKTTGYQPQMRPQSRSVHRCLLQIAAIPRHIEAHCAAEGRQGSYVSFSLRQIPCGVQLTRYEIFGFSPLPCAGVIPRVI